MRIKVAFLIYLVLDINGGDTLECLEDLKTCLSITDPDWIDCHRFFWLDSSEAILKKVDGSTCASLAVGSCLSRVSCVRLFEFHKPGLEDYARACHCLRY